MARNRILILAGEAAHVLMGPNVANNSSVLGAQTAIRKFSLDLGSLVTLVQQNDSELTAHQRTRPDLKVTLGHIAIHLLASSLVAPHTVTLNSKFILVHSDSFSILEDLECLGRSRGEVATD